MSLLPTRSDREIEQNVEVVGIEDEASEELFDSLASATARQVLLSLSNEPKPANELADDIDTTLQNTNYHLNKLESAGVVEAVDTEYSEKGREMTIYAPTGQPLVIVSGAESTELKQALRSVLGVLAGLIVASLIAQLLFPDVPTSEEIMNAAGGVSQPLPPGLVFFLGGAFVLVALSVVWYYRTTARADS